MTDNDENKDYEVGRGKPPKEHTWKPGQSGNPKGRPKQPRTIGEALIQAFSEKAFMNINGKAKKTTKMEMFGRVVVNDAIKNDKQSRNIIMRVYQDIYLPETKQGKNEEVSKLQKYLGERNLSSIDEERVHMEAIKLIRYMFNEQSKESQKYQQ